MCSVRNLAIEALSPVPSFIVGGSAFNVRRCLGGTWRRHSCLWLGERWRSRRASSAKRGRGASHGAHGTHGENPSASALSVCSVRNLAIEALSPVPSFIVGRSAVNVRRCLGGTWHRHSCLWLGERWRSRRVSSASASAKRGRGGPQFTCPPGLPPFQQPETPKLPTDTFVLHPGGRPQTIGGSWRLKLPGGAGRRHGQEGPRVSSFSGASARRLACPHGATRVSSFFEREREAREGGPRVSSFSSASASASAKSEREERRARSEARGASPVPTAPREFRVFRARARARARGARSEERGASPVPYGVRCLRALVTIRGDQRW